MCWSREVLQKARASSVTVKKDATKKDRDHRKRQRGKSELIAVNDELHWSAVNLP